MESGYTNGLDSDLNYISNSNQTTPKTPSNKEEFERVIKMRFVLDLTSFAYFDSLKKRLSNSKNEPIKRSKMVNSRRRIICTAKPWNSKKTTMT